MFTPVFPLPRDVIFHILTKIPLKTLIQLRCVSKSFNFLISHPDFLNAHLNTSIVAHPRHLLFYDSTDYKKIYFSFHDTHDFSRHEKLEAPFKSVYGYLRLVGSVKGLVCLFDTNYFTYVGTLILWNPFIKKFKILPALPGLDCCRNNDRHIAVGFGFDHKIVDFKIVTILCDSDDDDVDELRPEAVIYEVKNGSWRSIGKIVPCFLPKSWSSNVFVNGVVHWLAYKQPKLNGTPNCIMGFDVVDEIFKVIDLPSNLGSCKMLRLIPLVDDISSLALFVCFEEECHTWDLWVMEDYGKVESWTRKYRIMLDFDEFLPLKIVNGGDRLLAAAREDHRLVLIDTETEVITGVGVSGLWISFCIADYIPSLALINSGERLLQ